MSRSQPNSERDDFTRRMMSNIDGSQDTEIASLKARIEELEGALRKIANPIGFFREYAKEQGRELDGHMAVQISNDAGWLKSEAAKALEPKL